jgi:hypothetical protein
MSIFGPKKIKPHAVDHVAEFSRNLDAVIAKAMRDGVMGHVIIGELQAQISAEERRVAVSYSAAPRIYSGNLGDNFKRVS